MNFTNENQHYISKVLLNRFKIPNQALQCYQIANGTWEPKSIERLCSAEGYNQLLVSGEETNNALEASLSRVETLLPKTFKALEFAARQEITELPAPIYHNLRNYCAFLKLSSLFSKASAVVGFVQQLNMELAKGEYFLWRELEVASEIIAGFRLEYLAGGRAIIEAENVLQLIYRLQFQRLLDVNHCEMANADWTISISPIELPLSDIGVIQMHLENYKANHYLLPLGPRLLLDGIFYHDLSKNSVKTSIKGLEMTQEEAEYRLDCICLSSVREIICSQKNQDIPASLIRARDKGLRFARITNPDLVLAAGAKNASTKYSLRCVSQDEYRRFAHSYVMPPLN
jgi:Protein of unknown function (DUF4238)